ncbi:MAG: tetratricopeptide repeat-containing sensor histidine kinase [Bacteroidota bacterium]|nr:tetratricopeptide repeat-containing sensor histidine kinase [Bacteroidota bacterium]
MVKIIKALSLILILIILQQSPALSQHVNDQYKKAKESFDLGSEYDHKCNYGLALNNYLKAASIQEKSGDKAALVVTYSRIGEIYDTWGNYEKAFDYHNQGLEISKALGNKELTALSLYDIGILYDTEGKYSLALSYYRQAKEIYEKIKNKEGLVKVLLNMGNIDRLLSNFTESFDYCRRAINITEEISDKKLKSDSYYYFGMLFFSLKQYDKSLDNLLNSLDIREQIDDKKGKSLSLGYIGLVYYRLDDFNNALKYHKDALKIRREINDVAGIATSLHNIGNVNYKIKKYHDAENYYLQALKIRETTGNEYGTYETRRSLGDTYEKLGDYDKALYYFTKSLDFALRENLKERIAINYYGIAESYSLKGDYKNAFNYLSKYTALNDSIFNKDYKERLTELQIKYDAERAQKENQQLKVKQSEQSLQLQKQNTQIYLLLAAAFCGLIVSFGFYYRYHLTRKTKAILEQKNNEIALQKRKLEELNATKDKFFSIISHDLKNPFNTLIGFSDLLVNDFEHLSDEDKLISLKNISSTSQKSYQLLENLLEWSQIQSGKLKPQILSFDVKEVINECIALLESNAKIKDISINKEFIGSTVIKADCNIIKTVLRNLITNAIKYTEHGGIIKITSNEEAGHIRVSVQDNGIGISKEDIEKLFRIDVQKSRVGTSSEKGTGLGLILCKEFIEKCGGEISVESEPEKGSIFSFRI